ncbi:MAG TPA: hypothetical protein ENI33_09060 [Thermoplasmatales archaeon]|nr:hypothetical protein [Thermoplasmatales archaeon]
METVEIKIYADEQTNPNFICLGVLFLPIDKRKKLLQHLINIRCLFKKSNKWYWNYSDCPFKNECREEWHKLNNSEIHWKDLRDSRSSAAIKRISKNWLEFLIKNNKRDMGLIYFNLLYIELDKLDISRFGSKKEHENIYNKFFRTNLLYGIKTFFGNFSKVIIKRVYHDEASVRKHKYFPYLNLKKLEGLNYDKITVEDYNVKFLNSDHRTYLNGNRNFVDDCQLLQFIDLIIGATTQNIFYLSNDIFKKELAMIIRPLVERLLERPKNKNSSYHYYKKQHIGVFPKYKIDRAVKKMYRLNGTLMETFSKDLFYTNKKLKMPEFDPQQKTLSNNFWVKNDST